MVTSEYKDCLIYIENYWKRIIKDPKQAPKRNGFLKIPKRYITPNDKKFSYLFYWDTYFMFRGLLGTGKTDLLKEIIANYIYLLKYYGVIPNFNSHASTNRSQPPFFSSMILDVYYETKDKKWLRSTMKWAEFEYETVWIDRENEYNHRVEEYLLSKYGDRDVGYAHSSELESGWDFTSRFYNRCNDFLPIDLNCFLYKYELDFAKTAQILGDPDAEKKWLRMAKKRKTEINRLMWNEEIGFFFDYDFVHGKQSKFYSLASFVPLWAGVASADQAQRIMKHLPKFETEYGLLITDKESLPVALQKEIEHIQNDDYGHHLAESIKPKQWDYPNIWPPVEYMAVIGMLKYGLVDDAKRVMKKSLASEAKIFRTYGSFYEKRNGLQGDIADSFHYTHQGGFGWTNAVFYRYVQILSYMHEKGDEAIYEFPMSDNLPFQLTIIH